MLVTCISVARATNAWDLKTDWSETTNPNSPWSINEGANPLPHVTAWQQTTGGWSTAQPGWAKSQDGSDRLPFWHRSNGTEIFSPDSLAGDIIVHTTDPVNGGGNGTGNVTWTSPVAATISITGGVWAARDIGRSNDWKLYKNGVLLSSGSVSSGDAYNRATPFNFSAGSGGATAVHNIAVVIGDLIKLEIVKSSSFGDMVGVDLKIVAGSIWNSGPGANGHTYIPVNVPAGITWEAAENAAVAAGGHLAGIESADENAFVYALVSGSSFYWFTNGSGQAVGPWLGGYQTPVGTEPNQGWQWVGGYGFGYTNWAASQPDNANSGTDDRTIFFHPTAATGSFWNDYPAEPALLDLPRGYIIEIGPSSGNSTVWNTGTGANGHSYEAVLVSGGITWTEAEAAAVARGGHLASISSAEENAFVYALVSGRPEFWFDNAANDGAGPWIGGYQPEGSPEPAGGWFWSDGSAFTFTNWEAGEPNNFSAAENRTHLFNGNGGIGDKWNDAPHSGTTRGYIIEYGTTPGVPTGPESADMLYVASQTQNVVYQYRIDPTSAPTLVRSLTDGMDRPSGLAATDDGLFVVQRGDVGGLNAKVSRYLSADDTPAFTGYFTASSPVLDYAHGVAFRGEHMLVVDSGHNTVRRFQPDGAGSFVEQLPAIGNGIASTHARFVAVHPATQEVFVSLAEGSNKVARFLISGGGVITASGEITGNGLGNPHGIAFSPWGEMFVASYGGNLISRFVFDAGGAAVANGTITGNGVSGPINLIFSPWGELFVGNTGTSSISRFTFSESGGAQGNGSFAIPAVNVTALQFVNASAPIVPPACVPGVTTSVSDGLIAWWKGDGNADDFTGNNPGTEINNVTYEPGRFGLAFKVGGPGADRPMVNLGHLPQLKGASAYTVSIWLKMDATQPYGGMRLGLPVGNIPPPPAGTETVNNVRGFYFNGPTPFNSSKYWGVGFGANGNQLYYVNGTSYFDPGSPKWVHFAASWRSSDGLIRFYIDGVPIADKHAPAGVKFPDGIGDCAPAYLGVMNWCSGPNVTYADTATAPILHDDVRIYKRDLTADEIALIASGDDFNTCPPPNTGIPPLTAARVPAGVRVSWPSRFTGWSLEVSTDLINWTPVTGTPLLEASDFALTTSAAPVRQFFRLKRRGN